MAAAEVFVDDAVRGRLPRVCVKTGALADMDVRRSITLGRLGGGVWLLVLLGPLGWLALVAVAVLGPRRETLTVRLPYSRAAWDAERRRRYQVALLGVVGFAALALALVARQLFPLMWVAIGVVALLAAFVLGSVAYFDDVGVSLDASRRWVTLTRVSPAFAAALTGGEIRR